MIQILIKPDQKTIDKALTRPVFDQLKLTKIVRPIIDKVKRGGDKALRDLALEYDHVELENIWITEQEINHAIKSVDDGLKEAIKLAYTNIHRFHEAQKQDDLVMEVMPGVICSRRSVPIQKVGLYIPGGTAPLFSTVLMLAIPAQIAGCKEIIIASPTNRIGEINPAVLYAAHLTGVSKILKIGGAQAIAAMAYGTETVAKVDKIFGPGNQYVTAAKQMASQDAVSIDMPAGPSEVLVYVDKNANPAFAAADLLSQAEHGVDSQVILISRSKKNAIRINEEVVRQLELIPRKDLAIEALAKSSILIIKDKEQVINVINQYGPEHLIINTADADSVAEQIINAGSIFVGQYTPESAGDYASGTNHTLPTNGWASSYSGVSLDSYLKKITYQKISANGLKLLGPSVEKMAAAEQLEAHKNAVTIRLTDIEENGNREADKTSSEESSSLFICKG